ncbi:MAG: protein-L-isoaspartate(D-aspartate) O-methyltransferase [Candidatus Auribacterota bacterium]|nr:protein-L-isoaspartate(D-aspartate) O-methyltransferase [Candidatus Auribacterota bacterium]
MADLSDKMNTEASSIREMMVARQMEPRGITDDRVLRAFLEVPREEFIPGADLREAYGDHPLPIGNGQTISQPYMVAVMTQCLELRGEEKVLEIGTGSGYQAAILSRLARTVYSVERIEEIAQRTKGLLQRNNYDNVHISVGDGTLGWPEFAPYDGIIVTAGSPGIPGPLVEQLAEDGRLVIPAGSGYSQRLLVLTRRDGEIRQRDEGGCVFVPLIGEYGWKNR